MGESVLLIAYFFPPFGQTSSSRSGGMAKYLAHFGWKPIVLTRQWTPENGPFDPTITTGIPDDIVVTEVICDTERQSLPRRLLKSVNRLIFPQIVPVEFFEAATKELPGLSQRFEISAIWATAPPLCNLTLADRLSKATGIPWVADFRDVNQFTDTFGAALMRPMRLFREQQVLKSASSIIAVSEGFAETLRRRHRRVVDVIPNGFEPEDVPGPGLTDVFPKFEIVYTGGLNLGRPDFTVLLDALQQLCDSGTIDANEIAISFYGGGNEKRIEKLMRHPLGYTIRNYGHISRREVLNRQRAALILLQATSPGTGLLTSKIYEYLTAMRPILAIPRDDSISKLLRETNAGVCCTTKQEVMKQLAEWHAEWKRGEMIAWHGNIAEIMQYSRKQQAKQTAALLDRIVFGNGKKCPCRV